MAGLAALMTRKKRERRELELNKGHIQDSTASLTELSGKEAKAAAEKKAAHESIKKMLSGKELLHQKSKSFDAMSQVSYNDYDDDVKNIMGSAYSAIYIGLVLMCLGSVITFVGLGEKGFKTMELKMIGPILLIIGFASITIKIIHCSFPQLFQIPEFLKKRKTTDTDHSNLMEKGVKNGHIRKSSNQSTTKTSPQFISPRVTLQSSKKPNRPRSTIPNYIEDSSDDGDDFNPSNIRKQPQPTSIRKDSRNDSEGEANLGTLSQPQLQPQKSTNSAEVTPAATTSQQIHKDKEIVLTPKGLML